MDPIPCAECKKGHLLPFSDFGPLNGSAPEVRYKAWACSNSECKFLLTIDHGEVYHGRYMADSQNGRRA